MCKPPAPEVFEEMTHDEKINALYGVVLKLAARARFTNRWGVIALSLIVLPALGWIGTDRATQVGRIDGLERCVAIRSLQDSLVTTQILKEIGRASEEVKALREALEGLHPRGPRRP